MFYNRFQLFFFFFLMDKILASQHLFLEFLKKLKIISQITTSPTFKTSLSEKNFDDFTQNQFRFSMSNTFNLFFKEIKKALNPYIIIEKRCDNIQQSLRNFFTNNKQIDLNEESQQYFTIFFLRPLPFVHCNFKAFEEPFLINVVDIIYFMPGTNAIKIFSPNAAELKIDSNNVLLMINIQLIYCQEIIPTLYLEQIDSILDCSQDAYIGMLEEIVSEKKQDTTRNHHSKNLEYLPFYPADKLLDNFAINNFTELKNFHYHSYTQLIILCDLFSKKYNKNIKIIEKTRKLDIKCGDDDCTFQIKGREINGIVYIKTLKEHSCTTCASWNATRTTKRYLCQLDLKLSQLNAKYDLHITSKMRKYYQTQNNSDDILQIVTHALNIKNSGGVIYFPIYNIEKTESKTFHEFFILPSFCIEYLKSNIFLNVLTIDTTFLHSITKGHIDIIATRSGNNTNIPIAYGWSKSENATDISKMLLLLKNIVDEDCSITSDESQALELSIDTVFPNFLKRKCACHLQRKGGYYTFIFNILELDTKQEFDNALNKLLNSISDDSKKSKVEEIYKNNSRFYHPAFNLGKYTNNVCEQINSNIKSQNNQSISFILQYLYEYAYNSLIDLNSYESDDNILYNDFISQTLKQYSAKIDGNYKILSTQKHKIIIYDSFNEFEITDINGKMSCSCCRQYEMGFLCIHIYYYIKTLSICEEEKEKLIVKNIYHPAFLKENIRNFVSSMPSKYREMDYDLDQLKDMRYPFEFISKKEKRKEAKH